MFIKIFVYIFLFSPFLGINGHFHPKQSIPCLYEKEFPCPPQAFEKVYINGAMIFSNNEGTFLKRDDGYLEKIETLSHDYYGMYILRLKTQCPHCGKVYTGNKSPEGWSCLLYEREMAPKVWLQP